tara:strand:+ start:163 stop:579 length:417 start_codon:yes stop_codon:yes gene_type:complete
MKTTFKTLATVGMMTTLSAPAFAAAHTQMTCEEYNELNGMQRDEVAVMAISELSDNVVPSDGTATATENSIGETGSGEVAPESDGTASVEGSATATSIASADDDLTRYAEEIRILNRVCSRNWDATVMEAAAGQPGTR